MDEKYKGCNIVESVVKQVKKNKTARVRNAALKILLVKLIVAAVMIGFIFAVAYIPSAESVRGVIRDVFFYDIFSRTGFGSSIFA